MKTFIKISAITIVSFILGWVIHAQLNNPAVVSTLPPIFQSTQQPSLIGAWQNNPSMAAGWSDAYLFYDNSVFEYHASQMAQCGPTKRNYSGSWKLQGSELSLVYDAEETVNCGTQTLTETIKKTENFQPYERIFYVIHLGIYGEDILPSIVIDGKQYWKHDSDPGVYYK